MALILGLMSAPAAVAGQPDVAEESHSEAEDLLGTEREQLFEAYLAQIDALHVWSELGLTRLGITREQALEASKRRFVQANTRDDAYYALLSLQRSLHDRHSYLDAAELQTFLREQPEAKVSPRFPFFCRTEQCGLDEVLYEPREDALDLELAVLADHGCISSCDQFVSILKDNDLARVVGRPSSGGHSPFRIKESFELPGGPSVSMVLTVGVGYRANGEPLEGNPASVDHWLAPDSGEPETLYQRALDALDW